MGNKLKRTVFIANPGHLLMNVPPYSSPYRTAPAYSSAPYQQSSPSHQTSKVPYTGSPSFPYQAAYSGSPSVPAYPSPQGYPTGASSYPGAPVPVGAEPIYTRRCGYWFWSISCIFGVLSLAAAIYTAFLPLGFRYRIPFKVFGISSGLVSLFISYKILVDKKLTTESGNFKNVYAMFVAQLFLIFGRSAFLFQNSIYLLGRVLIFVLVFSLIPASILTMDESYDGFWACLKCLKPWAVENGLPYNMNNFRPPYQTHNYPSQVQTQPQHMAQPQVQTQAQFMPQPQFVPQYNSAPPMMQYGGKSQNF